MLWCRDCPRCSGDLVSQSDIYGEFISCLQCGCILSERQGPTARLRRSLRTAGKIIGSAECDTREAR